MKLSKREPIAIIGTACRFPGNVTNIEEYWEFLKKGGDAVGEIPKERWDWKFHYDEEIDKVGKTFVNRGGFMSHDIEKFDAAFFDISPREASILDPQQRLLLEVTFEALEDATGDVSKLRGSKTGVYMGCFMQDNLITQMGSGESKSQLGTYSAVSSTMTMISNRLSYSFDLQGPSFTLDTACSSSLVAVHQACRGLLAGDCDMAVTGGVNVMFRPEIMVMMSKGRFLAKDGRSKTFSANADGYGRGEGAGIVVLKRYSDAVRDGDTIHGVILGSGVNQDGNTDGITVPSEISQRSLARHVYKEAKINPNDISYIEAHGTGTPVGDPIEMRAMGKAISKKRSKKDNPLVVGSVKAGIGHLEAAAGIAGLLKSLLIVKHGEIPPQAWIDDELNPGIDFKGLNLSIADKLQAIPKSRDDKSYVAINSFGYGGTNAHAVVSKAPDLDKKKTKFKQTENRLCLNISAASESACEAYAKSYLKILKKSNSKQAAQLCRDVANKTQLTHRWSVRGNTLKELKSNLAFAIDEKMKPGITKGRAHNKVKPVFVFSGMGPQWWAMGHELMKSEPLFAKKLRKADKIFKKISGWSILDEMMKPEEKSRITDTEIAQPANFMIQMGLFELLKSWGVEPSAVVGHSVGEVSSGYASGCLSLKDALSISYHRSRTQAKTAGTGTMIATALSQNEADKYLEGLEERLSKKDIGKVSVAGINSVSNTTMSGDEKILDQIIEELEEKNVFVRKLRVEVPYHSAGMDPILDELRDSLSDLSPSMPTTPLYSTVTGEDTGNQLFDGPYWADNVREPVYFEQAVTNLLDSGHEVFLEVGPHPVLSGYIKESILKSTHKGICISTLKRKEDEALRLEDAMSDLWISGVDFSFENYLGYANKNSKLPVYPWQRKRHWSEGKYDRDSRQGWGDAHPLLGRKMPDPIPTWQSELSSTVIPWLDDHKVAKNTVFPGAGYVETLLAASIEASAESDKVLKNVKFHRAMLLNADEDATLKTVIENDNHINIFSGLDSKQDDWHLYAEADLISGNFSAPLTNPIDDLALEDFEEVSIPDLYEQFIDMGLAYGPEFQSIKQLKRLGHTAIIELKSKKDKRHILHPALLDGSFQAMLSVLGDDSNSAYLPVHIDEIRVHSEVGSRCQAVLNITAHESRFITADIVLIDKGKVAVEVLGVRCNAGQFTIDPVQAQLEDLSYRLSWYQTEYEEEGIVSDAKVAVVGERIPEDFEDGLKQFGCEEVIKYTTLDEFAHSSYVNDVSSLVMFVHSENAAQALDQSASAVMSLQVLHHAGYAGDLRMVTHEALAAEVRHSLNNWSTSWVTGLRRCAHNELAPISLLHVDIDDSVDGYTLAMEVCSATQLDEVALTNGERWAMQITRVNKTNYFDLQSQVQKPFVDNGHNNFSLTVPHHKSVSSLSFAADDRVTPVGYQIEVKVDYVALNYKDYSKVSGSLTQELVEKSYSGLSLGLECEGTVERVGELVKDYKVGDKVGVASADCFKRYVTVTTNHNETPHALVKTQPQTFKPGETASSFVAYGTALWGLADIARLTKDKSILIHGAAGGVGLAAVHIAKQIGAKVIASAGTQEKRDYLLSLGVDHVVNSRTLNFGSEVKALTDGKGVDVVFNSASGGIVQVSLEALAHFGHFIEIGKKDIFLGEKLELSQFEKSINYSTLDFEYLSIKAPMQVVDLFDRLFTSFESGDLPPLRMTEFGADNIQEAFTYISQSKQIGKVCINLNKTPNVGQYMERSGELSPDKAVVITGGFGGVGLSIANWCVDRGAKQLVLLSRKGAVTDDAKMAVQALQSRGAEVEVYACDASDMPALTDVFASVSNKWTIGGVIHAAGVLDDRLLLDLDEEAVRKVAQPKIVGASNLHELTVDNSELDFFWAFSSIAALSGNMYQTNYALANTFMDGLMEARQAAGLPGNAIQLGPVDEVGMASRDEELKQYLALRGMYYFDEKTLHACFDRVLQWNIPIMPMASLDWAVWEFAEPRAAGSHRCAILIESEGAGNTSDTVIGALAQLPVESRAETVGYMLIEYIADILQMDSEDVELEAPLDSFGIDSLTAVELQAAINRSLQVEISVLSMLGGKTILDIANELLGMIDFDQPQQEAIQLPSVAMNNDENPDAPEESTNVAG